jgi:protein-tyrosine-phosphatase/N-acetylglutamate synthase-like GNAT family acetyltransferase
MIRERPPRLSAMALLEAEGLPASDLTEAHLEHFFFTGTDGALSGLVGLEIRGEYALLRSLVVIAAARSQGLGSALVLHAEEYAAAHQVRSIYLLTTSAEPYFECRGYQRIDRARAPSSIQSTREFASLCPASSAFMIKRLNTERTYNVLFLCTGNSARSILGESLLNHWGKGRFRGFSAGSFPKGQVHPLAIDLLKRTGLPSEGLRSKSWDEFASPEAPPIDFIFTVCDNAAGEVCPIWPGKPMTAHWGIEDPAAVEGSGAHKAFAFRKALKELETRIKLFVSLPIASLDQMTLREKLRAIGQQPTTTDA